jgi:hypothetical protein
MTPYKFATLFATRSRRGQVLSTDFAISILIFSVVCIIAYTLLSNMIQDANYQAVQLQAKEVSSSVMTAGYPVSWTASGAAHAVRIGVVSDSEFSIRKLRLLRSFSSVDLKKALRVRDNFILYVTPTNNSKSALGVMGTCVIGDSSMVAYTEIPDNKSLSAVVVSKPGGIIRTAFGSEISSYDSFADAKSSIDTADVLILEGPSINESEYDDAMVLLTQRAKKGMTVFIIGDIRDFSSGSNLGISGEEFNVTIVSSVSSTDEGAVIGLSPGESILLSGSLPLLDADMSISSTFMPFAQDASGNYAYASWVYSDAQVYYFSTTTGTNSSGALISNSIISLVNSTINVAWPECTIPKIPADATQVVSYSRTAPYHDQLLDMNIVVWRNY